MTTNETPDLSLGHVVRITYIDGEGSRAYFDLLDGRNGSFRLELVAEAQIGEIWYLPIDTSLEAARKLPPEQWPAASLEVATVKVLSIDESMAIIESGNRLLAVPQRPDSPLEAGQTVIMHPGGRPGRLLTTEPVDRLGLGREDLFNIDSLKTDPSTIDVQLSDFGGSLATVSRASRLVRVALDPARRVQQIGANPVKGILFSGPSGTGKTHLARALSRHTGATFYLVDGPEMVNKWVGESEQRLRNLFADAQRNAPALIFFDELDSLVTSRGTDTSEHSGRLVGQLLTALDGFKAGEGVLVIAATNIPGALDTALLRPGRLGFKIEFDGHPDTNDRLDILKVSARRVRGSDTANLATLTGLTEGWTPAEIASIWTEAAILAALDERMELCADDVTHGFELAMTNRLISKKQVEST